MNKMLISVVIPTFNRANTISYCLNSVLAQTYNNCEIIVVDDCSTDNTVSIINSYKNPRVRCIILEKNSGAQAARNRGILEAKADWIAFQDSDDEWLPEKIEKQVAALAAHDFNPWVVVHTNAIRFDKSTGKKTVLMPFSIEGEDAYPTLLQSEGPLFPGMLVSKLALEKIGLLDTGCPAYQEWDTSIRLARYCRFVHIKEPLFIYAVGDPSAISSSGSKGVAGFDRIITKHEKEIKQTCGENAWNNLVVQLLRKCLNSGSIKKFDSNRTRLCLSDKDILKMAYLIICRNIHIKPDNILFRAAGKISALFRAQTT